MVYRHKLPAIAASVLLACASFGALPASAQSPTGYYAGKQVKMIIGLGTGGGYDLWARTVARHIGRHLPGNPTVISQNMEGAGSFRAASYMANQAPRDGTVMALIARDASLGPITGNPGAQFDPTKFSWLGTTTTETNVCIAYKTAAVKTVQDLTERELMVGDNGAGTGTGNYPKALNQLLGLKFKIIRGYIVVRRRGAGDGARRGRGLLREPRERASASARTGSRRARSTCCSRAASSPIPDLEGVPFVNDLAKSEDDRRAIEFLYAGQGIGRPFFAPPGLAPEVHKMMRAAFNATMKDPEFIADVKQRKLTLEPEDGEYMERLISRIYATPRSIVERVAALIK